MRFLILLNIFPNFFKVEVVIFNGKWIKHSILVLEFNLNSNRMLCNIKQTRIEMNKQVWPTLGEKVHEKLKQSN